MRTVIYASVVDGDLQAYKAAERLGIITRQLRRLTQRYPTERPVPEREQRVVSILRESYGDFGATLAAEKLAARHGIQVSRIADVSFLDGALSPPGNEVHDANHRFGNLLRQLDRGCVADQVLC